jgi:hypothetical protein
MIGQTHTQQHLCGCVMTSEYYDASNAPHNRVNPKILEKQKRRGCVEMYQFLHQHL